MAKGEGYERGVRRAGAAKVRDTHPIINQHQSTAGKGTELGSREINLNQRPPYTEQLQRCFYVNCFKLC